MENKPSTIVELIQKDYLSENEDSLKQKTAEIVQDFISRGLPNTTVCVNKQLQVHFEHNNKLIDHIIETLKQDFASIPLGKFKEKLLAIVDEEYKKLVPVAHSYLVKAGLAQRDMLSGYENTINNKKEKLKQTIETRLAILEKKDKAATISQSDSIVGDTWSILGIPINIKKLRAKLKSHPFLLCCCLLVIFIIVTYPFWHPFVNKTDRDPSVAYDSKESKVSDIIETPTKRISVPNPSLQKSVGTCEVIDIVKLFVEDVQGWGRWDTGAQAETPITWITEGRYDDPPEDMGLTFGSFARNGTVVLTIEDEPIYQQLKQTIVPGTWDIWLVGPNGGVLVVKMESEFGKDLPFDISKVLKTSGFKVALYKGLEVRNTTGNFIIYHIESPGGSKAWLAESWGIGTAGGAQEIWITYEQKYADILWEKEGSLGKQHLLWERESKE